MDGASFPDQVEHADGRVEIGDGVVLDDDALYNHDLAPTRMSQRTWTTYTYAALWISMAHCIPTYMLASDLIGTGMSWWQALVVILLGNLIVLIPILLNSHAGTKYGIPFPVFARSAYGVFGANVPAVMRALVACGWFGINTWVGGRALQAFFRSIVPSYQTMLGAKSGSCDALAKDYVGHPCGTFEWITTGHYPSEWLSFMLFWGLNILIVYKGMELVRHLENVAAPFVLLMTAALLIWAVRGAHGFGALFEDKGKFPTFGSFWPVFVPSVTAMVGFWATLSLNMPDFTRFGRSQREQTIGQVVALPTTMTVFSLMAIAITSASSKIFGEPIWDPIDLGSHFQSRLVVAVAMFTVVVATLGVNIAANVVSPANDFANLLPGKISFRTGGLITGIIGILMMPWKLIADPSGYIFKWLLGYSGGLGSIAGVLVVDYWIVRRKKLALADLYRRHGRYRGARWQGIVATAVGCGVAWIGLVVPVLKPLYSYAWFVGAGAAGLVYYATSLLDADRDSPSS